MGCKKLKKKGLGGWIYSLIVFCIVAAIILAILPQFDWDIGALFIWIWEQIWGFITNLGDKIANMPSFKSIFGN